MRLAIFVVIFLAVITLFLNRSYAHIYSTINTVNLPNPNLKSAAIGIGPELKYVALGDSLTAGVGVTNFQETYPYLFAEALPNSVTLINLANPGVTSKEVLQNQVNQALAEKPDLITILIGTNDIHNLVSPERFGENYSQIIGQLNNTGAKIVLINIPYLGAPSLVYFPYNYLLNFRINQFNQVIEQLAATNHLGFIDLYSKTYSQFSSSDQFYTKDLFHPNQKGYILIQQIINDSYH